MSDNIANPVAQIGGKLFGPVGQILNLGSKLERLTDRVNALREDQITLQGITSQVHTRSISNRDMAVDHKQRNDDLHRQVDTSISNLKQENITLKEDIGTLRELVIELKHQIELDARGRDIDLLKLKESLRQEMQTQFGWLPDYRNGHRPSIEVSKELIGGSKSENRPLA